MNLLWCSVSNLFLFIFILAIGYSALIPCNVYKVKSCFIKIT